MKKKIISLILSTMMLCTLAGCGSNTEKEGTTDDSNSSNVTETEEKEDQKEDDVESKDLSVGMVTDAGTIDDKSFNQGTWEGIKRAEGDLGISAKYLKPGGTTEADYLTEITNLIEGDYQMIVTPGYKFETAIMKAQDQYPDTKFVLIDGSPNNGKEGDAYEAKVGNNTIAIFFAEHESGFLAGVATSLELKEGELGFIGGMEIPAVQKFNWGFQQGVKYANENLGTNMTLNKENVVYEGSFDNVAGGQQIAAQMYERGVKAIFTAAGGVGVGAINEAKTRAKSGEDVWIIGVDVDQYDDGIYDEANNKSIILTSAVKKVDQASYDMIKDELDGKFQGGKTLTFDAKNDGIGLPEKNPNLSDETSKKVSEIFDMIKNGDIVVKDEQGDLIK
ncbi:BMP family ABC transporter substrate-binding protein [Clostridioides difficile]